MTERDDAADEAARADDEAARADDEAAGVASAPADVASAPAGPAKAAPRRRKGTTAAQTMGGIIFGFEQQIWRTAPPPLELVHHARPDASVPAKDGTMFTLELPSGVEDEEDR